jgi:hypothetical protein
LHLFYEKGFVNLSSLGVNQIAPMPSINATRTWLGEASINLVNVSNTTAWLIGYLRPTVTATYKLKLNTSVASILYLSSDENPNNKIPIANSSAPESREILLQNNTK